MSEKHDIQTSAEAMEAAALPDAGVVRTDDGECAERQPLPAALTRKPHEQKSPAEWAWQRLVLYMQKFEEGLNGDEEIGVAMAGSDAGPFRISGLGYFAPDLIAFYGRDGNGRPAQLVQHVSQLSVMLRALPKMIEHAEPNRIGFRLVEDLERA